MQVNITRQLSPILSAISAASRDFSGIQQQLYTDTLTDDTNDVYVTGE